MIRLGAIVTGTDNDNCGWTGNNVAGAIYRGICNSVAESATYTVAGGDTSIGFDTSVLSALHEVLTVTAMYDFDGRLGSTANRPAGRTTSTTPPPASAATLPPPPPTPTT